MSEETVDPAELRAKALAVLGPHRRMVRLILDGQGEPGNYALFEDEYGVTQTLDFADVKAIVRALLADHVTTDAAYEAGKENSHAALLSERDVLAAEMRLIDAVMARRPALDKPTRWQNIEHACATAQRETDRANRLEHDCDALTARVAGLIGVLKEYEEADINHGLAESRLKEVNDRADRLYREWQEAPTDELQHRRRENLDECLKQADVTAQARRRQQAARSELRNALTAVALNPDSPDLNTPASTNTAPVGEGDRNR
jgi:hypothetical protein